MKSAPLKNLVAIMLIAASVTPGVLLTRPAFALDAAIRN